MVMSGKERLRSQFRVVVEVLHSCPGNRNTVISTGAAADLIQDEQATFGGIVQDISSLNHLNHESGLTGMDLILSTDTGENAVDEADLGRVCWHEAADLGHQGDQSYLSDEC